MTIEKRVFLDLDGVIVDFDLGCRKVFDWPRRPRKPLETTQHFLGLTSHEFWKVIDSYGEKWWSELDLTNEAKDIINVVEKYDKNFTILTSPSLSHYAASGKVLWLQKHFGKSFVRYIITPHHNKSSLANSKSILIDDMEHNCKDFENKDGHSILVPQIWNRNYKIKDIVKYVDEQLSKFYESFND